MPSNEYDVAIVGGGFGGLTAAHALSKSGLKVCVLEADEKPGGLAGTFEFSDGVRLEKFYHHWFNNDLYVPELVRELGMEDDILLLPSRTGMYLNGRMWKLSTPLDLLRFKALSIIDRIRLGLLVFRVRRIKDWRAIEHLTIRQWLEPLCGITVYRTVWEPLVTSKFSQYAESVNAVWMWKKLVLRGSTRNAKGGEVLAYFRGGFGRLAEAMVDAIKRKNGEVYLGTKVISVQTNSIEVTGLSTEKGTIRAKQYLFTPAFPIIAKLFNGDQNRDWVNQLNRVQYLGNICLVLRLRNSLSGTYWLNVNDPGFPFVGVIEHTNLDNVSDYNNTHIAFLSRYLSVHDSVWQYSDEEYYKFSWNHLKRIFPQIDDSWVIEYKIWRADYAQPVTECNYSKYLPNDKTPYDNAWISTMAQIYPEDRGTNYAIRQGKILADKIAAILQME